MLFAARSAQRREASPYSAVVEQLLHGKDSQVQVDAIHRLEQIAQSEPRLRQDVIDQLCRYLRTAASHAERHVDASPDQRWRDTNTRSVATLAQSIITRHFRTITDSPGAQEFWPDLNLDLRDALLLNFDFGYCKAYNVSFERTRFTGGASFKNASISGYALFSGTSFDGFAVFDDVAYAKDAAYDSASFNGGTSFMRAKFSKDALFTRSSFDGGANFSWIKVDGRAWFDQVTFDGPSIFDRASFSRAAAFSQTRFSADATFTFCHFAQGATFDGASFEGNASFDGSTLIGDISFLDTQFSGSLSTTELSASAGFELSRSQYRELASSQLSAAASGDPRAMSNLGLILAQSGRVEEAQEWLRRAVEAATPVPCRISG